MKVEDIIEAIGTLTDEERRQVSAALRLMKDDDREWIEPGARFYGALRTEAENMGTGLPPFMRVRNTSGFNRFRDDCDSMREFLERVLTPGSETEWTHAYRLVARAVLRLLQKLEIPITITGVLRQTQNFEEAVDQSWPGYVQSGVLRLALDPTEMEA